MDWIEGAHLLQAAIVAVAALVGWVFGHFRKRK